jgi:hypothetical protein
VARGLTASFGFQPSFYPALPGVDQIVPGSLGLGSAPLGGFFHLAARGPAASFGFSRVHPALLGIWRLGDRLPLLGSVVFTLLYQALNGLVLPLWGRVERVRYPRRRGVASVLLCTAAGALVRDGFGWFGEMWPLFRKL